MIMGQHNMASLGQALDHPKKRRRRDDAQQPLSARLILDENIRGDIGSASYELLTALHPEWSNGSTSLEPSDRTSYVALQPWTPLAALVENLPWTIVPIEPRKRSSASEPDAAPSTIFFPTASPVLGSFLKSLEGLDPSRHLSETQKPIEIRVQPVVPLLLDTIYVTVQKDLIQTIDEVQSKFGGGFRGTVSSSTRRKDTGKNLGHQDAMGIPQTEANTSEERLQNAVREGLSRPKIVHTGDLVSLPLPAHPITHAPPPPAIVMACEPVNQGLLTPKTKIVLIQAQSSHERALKKLQPPKSAMKQVVEDEAEDTANEQFYSAAEDRESEVPSESEDASNEGSDMHESSEEHSDSDDSLDDIISLSAPGLPPQPSGTLSAMTAATPRPGGRRANGTQTPGSVYSNFTSTTSRPGRAIGKTFKAEMLLRRIPYEALFPRPADDEDDDSFIFVDINLLAKIGCFSGDWIKVDFSASAPNDYFGSLNLQNQDGGAVESTEWRAARIFGIPGLGSGRPQYSVNKSGDRRSSFSQMAAPVTSPSVSMPPIFFENVHESKHVKLSALPFASSRLPKHLAKDLKSSSTKLPPVAKEIVLTKIQTPSSTERSLDHAVFARLQIFFESKRRLLRSGDLIGLDVDEELARTVFSVVKSPESAADADLTNAMSSIPSHKVKKAIIWFSVKHISVDQNNEQDGQMEENPWGGVAVVDVSSTTIRQAGTEIRNLPQLAMKHWQYWHGVKKAPASYAETKPSTLSNPQLPDYYISPLQSRLRNLISAATSARAINLGLPPLVILLHSTQRQIGKTYTATHACSAAGVHTFPISAYEILAEGSATSGGGDVKTEGYLTARAERAFQCGAQHTALLIQHLEQLTADRMLPTLKDIIASSRVLIATTTEIEKIPEGIRGLFTHELEVRAPDESEREGILQNVVHDFSLHVSPTISLRSIALKTAALVAGDLLDVVYRASMARYQRLSTLLETQNELTDSTTPITMSSILLSGGNFATDVLSSDFDTAITAARAAFSASISAPKIPSVTWSDVGGLASAKSSIMETISLPLSHPSLFAKGLRKRSGILFYGPPGTGKTLLAKAIATEFSLNFFSVKGPELLNMYIGESEANVRRVFQRARDARPCVVFFDELDSVAPKRGNTGDSGGVMDRIVSQLLAELDGMSSGSSSEGSTGDESESSSTGGGAGVFVIGATNRPDLLDPALLRPGRFDKMIYLGIPDTHEKQLHILQALTRKFALAPGVNLERVADRLPLTYTGADLYALASDAMLKAVTRRADETDQNVTKLNADRRSRGMDEITTAWYFDHVATAEDVKVLVNEKDFDDASKELVGSVSEKELKHFEQIRQIFEEGEEAKTTPKPETMEERVAKLLSTGQQPTLPLRPSKPTDGAASRRRSSNSTEANPKPNGTNTINGTTASKGKGKGKAVIGNPDSGPDTDDDKRPPPTNGSFGHGDNSSSDDFIISTSHLKKSNTALSHADGRGPTKGKGKGKSKGDHQFQDGEFDKAGDEGSGGGGFMSFDEKDEELYG